jgi:D-alanyl-D-alanine carboxypeptidase
MSKTHPRLTFRTFLLVTLCPSLLASCSPRNTEDEIPPADLPFTTQLQDALRGVLVESPSDSPLGISAALIVPGYQPWRGVAGYSHADQPITPDTLFNVGSIEKNFEATLVLQLASEDRLHLDDPISMYVPDLPNVDSAITIRQLLNHTSGIFNVFEHPDFPWIGTDVDYERTWALDEVFTTLVEAPYGPPGDVQHYSSTNYLLLTEIIEEVTGNSVPTEIKSRLLDPLELQHTFTSMGERPATGYPVAHGWVDLDLDGKLEDFGGNPYDWLVSLSHPVMFTNADDLALWIHSIYHDRTVLESSLVDEMLTFPDVSSRDPEGGVYGIGVVDYYANLGIHAIGHAGSSLGYSAAALYLPEDGITIVWMLNTGESPPELAGELMLDTWEALTRVIEDNRNELRALPRTRE